MCRPSGARTWNTPLQYKPQPNLGQVRPNFDPPGPLGRRCIADKLQPKRTHGSDYDFSLQALHMTCHPLRPSRASSWATSAHPKHELAASVLHRTGGESLRAPARDSHYHSVTHVPSLRAKCAASRGIDALSQELLKMPTGGPLPLRGGVCHEVLPPLAARAATWWFAASWKTKTNPKTCARRSPTPDATAISKKPSPCLAKNGSCAGHCWKMHE